MLKIRKSSPQFRLKTVQEVNERLKFYNVGPAQIPRLIVLSLSDTGARPFDPNYTQIAVLTNATPQVQTFGDSAFANIAFRLHPVQD